MKARWLAVLSIAARVANAEPPAANGPPIVVVVDPDTVHLAPPCALSEAIAKDLSAPVLCGAASPSEQVRGTLTIANDAAGRFVLSWRDAEGNEIHRTVATARDSTATIELLALIAANLVRNEAEEILAEMAARSPQPAPVLSAEPATELSAPMATVVRSYPRDTPSRALSNRITLGTEAYLSSRSAERVYSPSSGLFLSYVVAPHVAIGLNDLMVLPVEGQTVLTGGPYIEAFWFARDWLQLFGQAGLPLQARWGGVIASGFGAQPYLGAGTRVWIGGHLSIGAGARLAIVASRLYYAPPVATVQGTLSLSGGVEIGVHL